MSIYQLACAVEGWNKAHGSQGDELAPLTIEEYEADMAMAAVRDAARMR